jgi:uncharacterized MnhB-related membrane protein
MPFSFWLKRTLLILSASVAVISLAQYLKTKDLPYALTQAAIWGAIATAVYLIVLWRKLRKNPACAVRANGRDQAEDRS